MSGWSNYAHGWQRVRRRDLSGVPSPVGRWTVPEVAATIAAFAVRWEIGLAFLALKLWQQASGYQGSVFAFTREKWEALVALTRSVLGGASIPSFNVGARSSGNHAFDTWRRSELSRIDAERAKLRQAEHEFTSYRDELLHAKDRDDFERFMRARGDASSVGQ